MRRIGKALAATIVLGACVPQHMDEGLRSLVGQNIQAAVARIGNPGAKRSIFGQTVYVWSSDPSALITQVNYNCRIQLETDEGGTIRNYQWSGDSGACGPYANALTR